MRCEKCDAELRDNAKFCDKCGEMVVKAKPAYASTKLMDVKPIAKPLDEKKNEPVESTSTSEKKETTKMTICIVLAVVVSILGLASCGNCVCSNDKSKDKQTLSVGTITESTTEETTEEFTTEEPTTEEPTTEEPTTEKPTEPPTEKPTEVTIMNNTSTDGFWAEGSGDYVATGLNVTRYGVLHIEYSGEGNFSIVSYEDDDYDDLLVNTTDDYYSGDVLIDHSGSFSLEISASGGSWSISSSGLSIDDSTSFSGSGDSVTGLTTHDGGIWEINHSGSENFAVVEYGYREGYMDLLVNEIGNYSGTVKAEAGDNIFFKVTADGDWSIEKK